ncbi:MAG: response regulator [Myxococcales bacterium]|nr:response regulator [Myxococcales bacterium]
MATRRILIIDTDQESIDKFNAFLKGYDVEVNAIDDSQNVKAVASSFRPELIILCAELSKKALGYAVCSKLKRDPELKSIPLILTSAEATQKKFDEHKKLPTRADEYLLKPFDQVQLLDKVVLFLPLEAKDGVAAGGKDDFDINFAELDSGGEHDSAPTADHLDSEDFPQFEGDDIDEFSDDFIESIDEGAIESLHPEKAEVAPPPTPNRSESSPPATPPVPTPAAPPPAAPTKAQSEPAPASAPKPVPKPVPKAENEATEAPGSDTSGPHVIGGGVKQQLLEALQENRKYKSRVSDLEIQLEMLEKRLSKREGELDEVRNKTSDADRSQLELRDRLMQKEKEVLDLRNRLNSAKKAAEEAEGELSTTRRRLEMLSAEKELLESQSDQTILQVSEANMIATQARSDAEQVQRQLDAAKAAHAREKTELESTIESLKGTLDETTSAKRDVEAELASLRDAAAAKENELKEELQAYGEKSRTVEARVFQLESQLDEKTIEAQELSENVAALESSLAETKAAAESAAKQAVEDKASALAAAADDTKRQLNDAQARADAAKAEFEEKIRAVEEEKRGLEESIELLQAEKRELESTMNQTTQVLQGDIDRLTKVKSDLEANVASIEAEKSEINDKLTGSFNEIKALRAVQGQLRELLAKASELVSTES